MSHSALVLTHRWPQETACAFEPLVGAAREAGWKLLFDRHETAKHGLSGNDVVITNADSSTPVDACVVLGGDGTILNRSHDEVDVIVDGRPVWELAAGESLDATFAHDVSALAQVPGSTFYRRLREKFGRLSS